MRVFDIPEGSRQSKGRAIQNLIQIPGDDKVMAYINTKDLKDEDYINSQYIMMCTKNGVVKKTSLEKYSRPRANGIKAIIVRDGDELLEAKLTSGQSHIVLALKSGKAIHFEETKVRPMGRGSSGVRGITLAGPKDSVVGMICAEEGEDVSVLVVSENGYGKRSDLDDYRITNRGGKGVKTLNVTDKTGALIAIKAVRDGDHLMIINRSGIIIRFSLDELRVMGRATQGVKLIDLRGKDQIAAVAKIDADLYEEEEGEDAEIAAVDPSIENTSKEGSADSGTEIDNEGEEE
jgi:DNA gyrase subunit A